MQQKRRDPVPRRLSLVKLNKQRISSKVTPRYPFQMDAVFVFLGEIPNMREHCVLLEVSSGRCFSGFHSNLFVEISPDDA
jgi:hypothetical protein